ncbi:acetylxylan esterase [Lacticaseibacillus mingshuiensis]|uniref:Acetylxylan esterase n=2 Tax=Lacticaseibacillus mingshuiensis TaxID=2799574 RepID=A0ABW4CH03_9LACO|nr:acetylxylan esterase [Lacticaseibacillus mingshuiensis]
MNEAGVFWQGLIDELYASDIKLSIVPSKVAATTVNVADVAFTSLYGERVHGYLIQPQRDHTSPLVIDYLGYMNHLEDPMQFYHWPSIGFSVLVIDNRGQGGKTLDTSPYAMTYGKMPMGQGFTDPDDFYMKRVIADHLLELKIAHDLVASSGQPLFLRGGSQGGGLATMIGALSPYDLTAIFSDVPSQSNLMARIDARAGSYGVIGEYLAVYPEKRAAVERTMRFYDTQFFAAQIKAPVFASCGDQDTTCPMADYLPTFDQIQSPKELKVYTGHAHEGGGIARIRWEVDKAATLAQRV